MNRRTFGRGRLLATLGSLVILVAALLPWGRTAGVGLPAQTTPGWAGAGIIVILAAVAVLALIALPYAMGDQPSALDRAASFAVVAGVGVIGLVLRAMQLGSSGVLGLPDRSAGLWIAGIGLAIVLWGVAEIASERRTG